MHTIGERNENVRFVARFPVQAKARQIASPPEWFLYSFTYGVLFF